MNDIQIFNNPEFGEIRTVVIDNEPWFVGKDIADSLGYAAARNAIAKFVENEDKLTHQISAAGQIRDMTIINESGLYSLIFGSKLESAKKFKKWVTSEVLPSIRKTGTYTVPQTTDGKIALLAQGHTELKAEVNELKEDLEVLKMDLPLLPVEADIISNEAKRKGTEVLGGKGSPAYKSKSLRQNVFANIYGNLKYNFGITGTYKKLKRCQCEKVVEIIRRYSPPPYLKEKIEAENARLRFDA